MLTVRHLLKKLLCNLASASYLPLPVLEWPSLRLPPMPRWFGCRPRRVPCGGHATLSKAGTLLREMKANGQREVGGRPRKPSGDVIVSVNPQTLSDLGISYDQSSQWQQLAEIPAAGAALSRVAQPN